MGIFNHNSYDDHSKDDKSIVTKEQLDALSTRIDNLANNRTSLYEKLFDYWFDCLDPNTFNFIHQSNITYISKINEKLTFGSLKTLNDFDYKLGFPFGTSYIELDKDYNQNNDFTIYIAFKHDGTLSGQDLTVGFIDKSNSLKPPYIQVTKSQLEIHTTPVAASTVNLHSQIDGTNLLLMFTKKGNVYRGIIDNAITTIHETIPSVNPFQSNKIQIQYPGYIKQVGFSSKPFNQFDTQFFQIIILNKLHPHIVDNYFYTTNLQHDNESTVKFPATNRGMVTVDSATPQKIKFHFLGVYQIIYTDFYKRQGTFTIEDTTTDSGNNDILFTTLLDNQSNWTPIMFNAIITITKKLTKLSFILKPSGCIFDGVGYSTLYIKKMYN